MLLALVHLDSPAGSTHLQVAAKGLKVHPRLVPHQVVHGGTAEGRTKIQHLPLVGQLQLAADRLLGDGERGGCLKRG